MLIAYQTVLNKRRIMVQIYILLLKANESCLKFYASNNDSNPPNKENIPPKFPRLK